MKTLGRTTLLAAALLAGCATEEMLTDAQYAAQARESMEAEAYDLAVDSYQKLLEQYPFSDLAEEAQLELGRAQYENEQYAEAIATFQDFQRMHPTNPNLGLTEYYTALAYYDQMGKKDRDQRAADNAQAHFKALIERYPESPYLEQAKEKLAACREILAEHEYAIADFYLRWENPLGAEARLKRLVENYSDTRVATDALVRFGDYFRSRGDLVRAGLAYGAVVDSFPTSESAATAKEKLEALRATNVEIPAGPLPALVETLGRPSIAREVASSGAPGEQVVNPVLTDPESATN